MNFVSVGDLSRAFTLRNSNAALRSDIQRMSKEVTTGVKSDIPKHLNGDLIGLAEIEHGLRQSQSFRRVGAEASATGVAIQAALGTLQQIADDASAPMLSGGMLASPASLQVVANTARDQLGSAIAALNSSAAGKYVLSGAQSTTPPLVSAETLMAQALTVVAGASTAAEVSDRLKDYFDAPRGTGGFADQSYRGSHQPAPEFLLDPSSTARFDQTANNQGVRDVLRGLVLGALAADGTLAGNHTEQSKLMEDAALALAEGNTHLSVARSEVGMTQQRIERTTQRLDSLATHLGIERSNLISADSYEAGSHLVQAQTQLEALFALTSRLSNLSLAKFL